MIDVNNFDALRIGLAAPDHIRARSSGEVKKPETINYRTLKPEKDGLFCEKIFGPTKDWECHCGRYKRIRYKGLICERCGVEVTRAKVRRDRMAHIELAAPVSHIWFFKGVPSRMGYLLDITPRDLEKVLYFASYIVTRADREKIDNDKDDLRKELEDRVARTDVEREEVIRDIEDSREQRLSGVPVEVDLPDLDIDLSALPEDEEPEIAPEPVEIKMRPLTAKEIKKVEDDIRKEIKNIEDAAVKRQDMLRQAFDFLMDMKPKQLINDENLYRELCDTYEEYFSGGMGAEAVKELLQSIDLQEEVDTLRELMKTATGQKRSRIVKRYRVAKGFQRSENKPEWMILSAIPVIPPDLRPMVQLDGGRFATSDLNDLYRRVINRNNRLRRLLDLSAPDIIVNNEKRMLQEAVDALFDNGRRGRPVTGPGNRPLKSISDMLKGKQGRFRQNLLGKRVDYSGRSVIVVGPELKLHQCGLPKIMALELFKPFVMKRLVDRGVSQNIKSAKRDVERQRSVVWDVLEEVIKEHPVMLNRAPTLHRLGIQAFEPILVEGKAIQIHPLVCTAFNADFDGDQMAVHLPLSEEAQAEARILMLSTHNMLSPASGRPLTTPTQDMVLGIYSLTAHRDGSKGEGMIFRNVDEAIMAVDAKEASKNAMIKVRMDGQIIETTTGRLIFNEALPEGYEYQNKDITKKDLSVIVADCAERYRAADVADTLDKLKNLGFHYATRSGITIGVTDVVIPDEKAAIVEASEKKAHAKDEEYRMGITTAAERHKELVRIWDECTDDVTAAMTKNFSRFNPVFMMANSGARGNMTQIRQLAGMRGLMSNPKGDVIDRPVKANFREGCSVLEFFITTHGARKGLADTALRTADSGYLTRRLVDVAQEVIVREEDCGTERGLDFDVRIPSGPRTGEVNRGLLGRAAQHAIADPKTGEVICDSNQGITESVLRRIVDAEVAQVSVRSVLACEARHGVCSHCYGYNLSTGRMADIGEAVGIIAAQSIGEPGTQLTMRTFHTGGVATGDITMGFPRITELFEARSPKRRAIAAEISGKVSIHEEEDKKSRIVRISDSDGEEAEHSVPSHVKLSVEEGQMVEAGLQLTAGDLSPHDILRIQGAAAAHKLLVKEVLRVYEQQGVEINDKHIEVIIRQMMRRVRIVTSGDTEMLPGEDVDRWAFKAENSRVEEEGGEAATAGDMLMGITKASLATASFLSAASFQETTRVLTEASIGCFGDFVGEASTAGSTDRLLGLKENVIIGKLIPAGTGMRRYRSVQPVLPEDAREIAARNILPGLFAIGQDTAGDLPDQDEDIVDEDAVVESGAQIEEPVSH